MRVGPGVAVALAAAGMVLTSSAATAQSIGRGAPAGGVEPSAQERVDAVADQIWGASDTRGLAGVRVDAGTLTVQAWWKGKAPADVSSLVTSSATGVRVSILPARFSASEMSAASQRVFAGAHARTYRVAVVHLPDDGSGIGVTLQRGSMGAQSDAARVAISADAGIPVTLSEGDMSVTTSRQDDSSPWFGGGAMKLNPNGYLDCSTGFSVLTTGGYGRLVSAAHCDTSGSAAWYDGAGDQLSLGGSYVMNHPKYDSMLIDPVGGTGGQVHGGPWNATSANARYHLKVAGAGGNSTGDKVCTSGANSGEHCNLTVKGKINFECPGSNVCAGWYAEASSGVATVGGDSGGPVYANRSDGRVGARGVIHGGAGDVPCPSMAAPTNKCLRQVFYVPILDVLSTWGVEIETAS